MCTLVRSALLLTASVCPDPQSAQGSFLLFLKLIKHFGVLPTGCQAPRLPSGSVDSDQEAEHIPGLPGMPKGWGSTGRGREVRAGF